VLRISYYSLIKHNHISKLVYHGPTPSVVSTQTPLAQLYTSQKLSTNFLDWHAARWVKSMKRHRLYDRAYGLLGWHWGFPRVLRTCGGMVGFYKSDFFSLIILLNPLTADFSARVPEIQWVSWLAWFAFQLCFTLLHLARNFPLAVCTCFTHHVHVLNFVPSDMFCRVDIDTMHCS
jgi:hypothetical protein